jgi:soluble lytic murein transglycosylase-like protein
MPGYSEARFHLQAASELFRVDMALLQALTATESGFDPRAVSPKGAVGLMQVMPATAARYGLTAESDEAASEKLKDPSVNVNMGTRYLRDLLIQFSGDRSLALAAYNAGEGAVKKAGNRIPDFKETQNYVKTVLQLVDGLDSGAGPTRAPGMNSVVQTIGAKAPQPNMPLRKAAPGAAVQMITDRASAQTHVVSTAVPPKN